MKPTIRDATIADAPAISELICRVAQETIFADGPEEGCRYFLAMNTPAAVAGKMSGHAYRYYVAELPDRIVGLAAILNNAHLYHLCIDTNVKGTGVGRRLLEHVRDECLRRGNPGRFTVDSTLDAIKFYERFDFVVAGEERVRNGHAAVPMALNIVGQKR
jgi:GNAT superfamily N-acetyltransferase